MKTLVLLAMAVGSAMAVNILPNPSFEVWLDSLGVSMPLGWLTSEYLYPGSAVKDTQANTGDFCLRLVGGDTSAFTTSVTVVRSGYHYEFAGHTKVPVVLGGSFVLQFLSLLGQPVGLPQLVPVYNSSSYRRYSRWVTAPDSALFLSVTFATLPGVEVRVDDITVEDTTLAGIDSEPVAPVRRPGWRKVVVAGAWSSPDGGKPGRLYDALGRPADGRRAGVYFKR
ncbi:MAG: hypothetical protein ABIK37_02770 [candidate division WOR-3 bacterium]